MESVPQVPQIPCTEMAPTGSSTRTRSKNDTANTTSAPPMAPMITASRVEIAPTGAVTETSPARRPLAAIDTSGLPSLSQFTIIADDGTRHSRPRAS